MCSFSRLKSFIVRAEKYYIEWQVQDDRRLSLLVSQLINRSVSRPLYLKDMLAFEFIP